jgi:probable phosphoglycerate mutase
VSDLHCAATVLVTRHGEAEYESDLLSDSGGSLTLAGRRESERLAEMLQHRNVAMVYTSPLARASRRQRSWQRGWAASYAYGTGWPSCRSATTRAAGVPGAVHAGVQRWRPATCPPRPGRTDGAATVARVRAVLEEVADLHRGETVLVVSHGGAMSLVLPRMALNLPDDHGAGRELPGCVPVELSADADGWTCAGWP